MAVNPTGHCRDCRYLLTKVKNASWMTDRTICGLVSSVKPKDYPGLYIVSSQKQLATPIDGDDYWVWLAVKPDFGCVQFEAKSDGS